MSTAICKRKIKALCWFGAVFWDFLKNARVMIAQKASSLPVSDWQQLHNDPKHTTNVVKTYLQRKTHYAISQGWGLPRAWSSTSNLSSENKTKTAVSLMHKGQENYNIPKSEPVLCISVSFELALKSLTKTFLLAKDKICYPLMYLFV